MATSTPPPSNPSPSSSSNGVSGRSLWAQHLWWLISALSGTLEVEADIKRLKQENAKLDEMILQVRNEKRQLKKETEQIKKETERIKKDNERLAELESKIDSSFRKYGINLPLTQIPDQP